ncbi:MAG: hypothetical protein IKB42_02280 [Clostridia bacterium]|nr:hypothetical protein [Clostridia bacterium]
MPNTNREFLQKRSDFINKLRRKATGFQIAAVVLIVVGFAITIISNTLEVENVWLTLLSLVSLFFGICFQVTTVIYFSKAKKHLSGQTVSASSNPKDWQ